MASTPQRKRKVKRAAEQMHRLHEEDIEEPAEGPGLKQETVFRAGLPEQDRQGPDDRITLSNFGAGLILLGGIGGAVFLVFGVIGSGTSGQGFEDAVFGSSSRSFYFFIASLGLMAGGFVLYLMGKKGEGNGKQIKALKKD